MKNTSNTRPGEGLTFEKVWAMFQETNKQFREMREQSRETDRQFKETDRKFREMQQEIGGIGQSNGEFAEGFFYIAFDNSLQAGKMKFDFVSHNLHRKKKSKEAEYDIVLYNNYKVLLVEVKY